mmetsp:Transcript_74575/g.216345  ORF Transcript_74575/g.216345 Transcript_74575/m.216345 type:complete len:256 (-) Transcript_74575:1024-1791(-)
MEARAERRDACRSAFANSFATRCASAASSCRRAMSPLEDLGRPCFPFPAPPSAFSALRRFAARRALARRSSCMPLSSSSEIFLESPHFTRKSSTSSSSRSFRMTSSWRWRKRFCRFVSFCPKAPGVSRPVDAKEASAPLAWALSSASSSPRRCSNKLSWSMVMSSSSSSGSASRWAFRASVALAKAAAFATASGPSASPSLSDPSSSSPSPSLPSSPSASRMEAERLVSVSSVMNSPSSRQAARAASLTMPVPVT